MENLRTSFERELKTKLAQKSSGNQNEEAVLMRAFKYFDLNNNGTVEPDEFAKAIEKIGIMIPTQQDLEALFSIYDTDRSGALDYKEFSTGLFGKDPRGGSPSKPGGSSPDELVERLRNKLASRGARGIIGLGKSFRIMDDNNSRSLDVYEFSKAMKDYMLGFSDAELKTLYSYFDSDRSGNVDYDEFLRALRGPMNPFRKKLVAQAFNKLDKDRSGMIDINDIKGVYNA
jgi:Ca2+-binding EF-hand superfamily protein